MEMKEREREKDLAVAGNAGKKNYYKYMKL